MFDTRQFEKINPQYFNIIMLSEHDVTVQSKNTGCYSAFYLVLNHATFKQIKKRHSINDSDGFYIGLLYAVPLVLS